MQRSELLSVEGVRELEPHLCFMDLFVLAGSERCASLAACSTPCLQSLEQYNPADMVQSLCRMISYNIGQLAYLNAKR